MTVSRKPQRASVDDAQLRRDIQDIFSRLSEGTAGPAALGEWAPSVDVYEARGRFTVVIEVPGLPPESLRVAHRDGNLVVSGERKHRRPPGAAGFLCLERPHGRFSRTIPLEEALDLAGAEARLHRGLLVVEVPRLKDRRGKETPIPVRREGKE